MDDWLAGQDDFNWLDDPRGGEAPAGRPDPGVRQDRAHGGRPSAGPIGRREGGRAPADAETIARRRSILALATVGLVVVTVVAVVIATSGGGGSGGIPAAVPTVAATTSATPPATATGTAGSSSAGQTTPAQTQSTSASTTLKVTLPSSGTLSIGDTGSEVVALQTALAALKLKVGKPDGNFGAATQAAVIAFQTAHGLNPDGIVGSTTAQKLNAALAGPTAAG